ncbi:hypothetical protein NQZ68_007223 [Dissostichus eleginoides]|nr:hypothetical protein NQZ68_007223 [Dissostichus eleginoides]
MTLSIQGRQPAEQPSRFLPDSTCGHWPPTEWTNFDETRFGTQRVTIEHVSPGDKAANVFGN